MSGIFVTDGNLVHNFSRDYMDANFEFEEIYNYTNSSLADNGPPEKELWREIPLGIVLTLLCLLTSIGNAMVLHAVRTERRLQSVSNMFIVSLAIADLIVGLFVMPISTVYIFTEEWLFGIAVCQIWIGIDYTASTASILNLFILSLDRYWSVTSPLKYIRKRTKKRAVIMITIVWMVSSLWIIPIAGWHHFFHGGTRTVPNDTCDTEYAKNTVLKVVTAFFNFYLPLAIMYALYWKIFQEIRKRSELELGQRNVKNCKNSYNSSYIPNMNSCNEDLSYSDANGDTGSDNNSLNNVHYVCNHSSNEVSLYDMSAMKPERIKRGYFSLRFLNRTKSERLDPKNNVSDRVNYHCKRGKVEYVYDENVIDEETEKVERFYYEDTSGVPSNHKHNVLISRGERNKVLSAYENHRHLEPCCTHPSISQTNSPGDKTMSLPSTPISSSSSTDDKRIKMIEKEKYSILRGLKKIREAENIFDTSVNSQRKKANHSTRNNAFVFRDERLRRRASNKFNIKDRIKNIRQSSALTKEIKAARQLGVIMGAFTLCFLPYFILFLVVAFCDGCIDQGLLLAMTWVGYLNSTLNPFLYPLCNANFRRKFRSMLQLRHKRRRRKRNFHDQNSITTARYD